MANEKDEHACTLDKIISLCKRRGFVYQASEIYGGQAGAWDYGPLGVEFKRNLFACIFTRLINVVFGSKLFYNLFHWFRKSFCNFITMLTPFFSCH